MNIETSTIRTDDEGRVVSVTYDDRPETGPPSENERRDAECVVCGHVRECAWTSDPFAAEIHPAADNPPAWRCDDCLRESSRDI